MRQGKSILNNKIIDWRPGIAVMMFLKPFLNLFAVMDTDIIANDVNHSDLGWGGLIHVLKEGDEFLLPFTS